MEFNSAEEDEDGDKDEGVDEDGNWDEVVNEDDVGEGFVGEEEGCPFTLGSGCSTSNGTI
jgi:hypothetical protein